MKHTFAASLCLASLLIPAARVRAAEPIGFDLTRSLVEARTGVPLRWNQAKGAETPGDTLDALLRGELTEDRAVRVALLNNHSLQATLDDIGVSRADLRQALLPRNPSIEGEIRFGGAGHHPGEIVAMQDLTSILLIPLRRSAASSALRQRALEAAHAALGLVAETRTAFFRLQAAGQIHELWRTTGDAAQTSADLARRQREAGNITQLDLENEQALYEQARIELAHSDAEISGLREALHRLMAVWGEQTGWTIAPHLPAAPDSDAFPTPLEALAIVQGADLAAAEAEIHAADRSASLARFAQFPELRAGMHFEREPEGSRSSGPTLELAIPLFDRGQASVDRARAQRRQAQNRRAALAVEIRSEVRVARDRVVATHALMNYYREGVLPRRRRIVQQTQLEFNGMLIGVYQLLQARQSEVSAEREYLEAQRDYWIARTELDRALGGNTSAAGAQ